MISTHLAAGRRCRSNISGLRLYTTTTSKRQQIFVNRLSLDHQRQHGLQQKPHQRKTPSYFCKSYTDLSSSKPTFNSKLDDIKDPSKITLLQQAAAANRTFSRSDDHIAWKPIPKHSLSGYIPLYNKLSKDKLSVLIVLTAMAGYAIAPTDPTSTSMALESLASTLPSGVPTPTPNLPTSTDVTTLLATTIGTYLCCASTNAVNEMVEHPYDAQMPRTRSRPVVRRYLSPLHAFSFSAVTGSLGFATLYNLVNPLTAYIGLSNILLYAFIYTPSKRYTQANTWIGAVVGSLPPLMGWAACTGSIDIMTQPGAWALFLILFAWQFPHFNSLAWTLRREYAIAGYRMMSVINPRKNALIAFRYSLALFPLCLSLPYLGVTGPLFSYLSFIPNAGLTYAAFKFWRASGPARDFAARHLFFASLIHLPAVLILLMACKLGMDNDNQELESQQKVLLDTNTSSTTPISSTPSSS